MDKSTIKIFFRLRPFNGSHNHYSVERPLDKPHRVTFSLERHNVQESVEELCFKFNGIFGVDATQEQVYNAVCRPAVKSAVEGYNATVFAYGQTGSGKTFTLTGGTTSYTDRGLIPRALQQVYDEVAALASTAEVTVRLSYLQIYNEKGTDLLNRLKDARSMEELPKVTVHEDDDGILLRGLEMHAAPRVEDALNLLFLGDTNRMYAETPMNLASSRSHCVFTISIEQRPHGGTAVRRSKLHLVDLAGSERVHQSGVSGNRLTEAKHINLSLHYLESVITALAERASGKRDHVPFRNSMLTQVLRDSLGGNCVTTMIAAAHSSQQYIGETVSTCRFAQRVACIRQDARVNDEVDPAAVIRRLKAEVAELKDKVAYMTKSAGGVDPCRVMPPEEEDAVRDLLNTWLTDGDPQVKFSGLNGDIARFDFVLLELKKRLAAGGRASSSRGAPAISAGKGPTASAVAGGGGGGEKGGGGGADASTMRRLQAEVQQRDNEIELLLQMINAGDVGGSGSMTREAVQAKLQQRQAEKAAARTAAATAAATGIATAGLSQDAQDDAELRKRAAAFEEFRRSRRQYEAMERSKAELGSKMGEAKKLAAEINTHSAAINAIRGKLQAARTERALNGGTEDDAAADAAAEAPLLEKMEEEKSAYRQRAAALKALKGEIEAYREMLERAKVQQQRDFESWYAARA